MQVTCLIISMLSFSASTARMNILLYLQKHDFMFYAAYISYKVF